MVTATPGFCKQCQHEVGMVEGYEKCCGMAKPNCNFCDDSGHQEGIFIFSETAGRAMTNYETLQGYSAVSHCQDTLQLGAAGILCDWALQGYVVVEHCRIPCSWAW